MSDAGSCLFCKIVKGEIPAEIVARNDEFVAFRDINGQAPTHVLVVPVRHIERVTELTDADAGLAGGLLLFGNRVASEAGIAEPGFRLVINCNDQGGQSVYHLHLHVLGGRAMVWPPG